MLSDQAEKPKKQTVIRKKKGDLSHKTKKAIELSIKHGVDAKEAYRLANGKEPTPAALSRIKEKVRKYSLTAAPMVKLAHSVVKDALQGKAQEYKQQRFDSKKGQVIEFTEVVAPSVTNKLAAASMVLDRDQPLKGSGSDGPASFVQINVNHYHNSADTFTSPQVIDITDNQ